MKLIKLTLSAFCFAIIATSCGDRGENKGASTPIDSTNVKGTAPATYGGDNPAINPDSNRTNVGDTGTKANNVHNTGYDTTKR